MKRISIMFILLLCLFSIAHSEPPSIPFDSDRWDVINGQTREFLDRRCFSGIAILKDLNFDNG